MTAPDREHFQEGACDGGCCRLISLSAAPEEVASMAARAAQRRLRNPDEPRHDSEFVAARFIATRRSYDDPITQRRWPDGNQPRTIYRCVEFDGRKCKSYETRPEFCRWHGSPGNTCRRPGCALRWDPIWRALDRWADDGG